jgi:hypothetical protein
LLDRKYSIISPAGGFGNHLRWLMLMSSNFNDLSQLNAPSFLKTGAMMPLNGKQKVEFIKKYVYNSSRTVFNWIALEWKFRTQLNNIIGFDHSVKHYDFNVIRKDNKHHKVIVCNATPEESLYLFGKFMPFLNNTSLEGFLQMCEENITRIKNFVATENEEFFHILSKDLYTRELNHSLYKSLIDFYEIEDEYESANDIHGMWFDLQEKALSDLLTIIDDLSVDNFPWFFYGDNDHARLHSNIVIKGGFGHLTGFDRNKKRVQIAIDNLKQIYKR